MLVLPLKIKLTISKKHVMQSIVIVFAEGFSCSVFERKSSFSLRCAVHLPWAQKLHPK